MSNTHVAHISTIYKEKIRANLFPKTIPNEMSSHENSGHDKKYSQRLKASGDFYAP